LKHPDRFFATTVRLRSEGTDHLLAAAEATGVSHIVAQGFGAFNGIREGGWVKTEEDPLDPGPASARKGAEALGHLENMIVKAGGAVLRYGSLYGPGAIDDWVELVRIDILRSARVRREEYVGQWFPEPLLTDPCESCSPPTFSWSGTVAARPRRWPGASSALRRWPGCWPRSSPGSYGSR
jgi:hypothetical protein